MKEEESDSDTDTEHEQNISKIRLCSSHFCWERRCSHDRRNAYFHFKKENVENHGVGGAQVEKGGEELGWKVVKTRRRRRKERAAQKNEYGSEIECAKVKACV